MMNTMVRFAALSVAAILATAPNGTNADVAMTAPAACRHQATTASGESNLQYQSNRLIVSGVASTINVDCAITQVFGPTDGFSVADMDRVEMRVTDSSSTIGISGSFCVMHGSTSTANCGVPATSTGAFTGYKLLTMDEPSGLFDPTNQAIIQLSIPNSTLWSFVAYDDV